MGGVDKSGMMLALYRTRFRTRKWCQRIATQLFSQACVNWWIIHRSLHETVTSLTYIEFLQKICQCFMDGLRTVDSDDDEDLVFQTQPKEKSVRTQDIPLVLRYDKYDH